MASGSKRTSRTLRLANEIHEAIERSTILPWLKNGRSSVSDLPGAFKETDWRMLK